MTFTDMGSIFSSYLCDCVVEMFGFLSAFIPQWDEDVKRLLLGLIQKRELKKGCAIICHKQQQIVAVLIIKTLFGLTIMV
jgi:hypothetical protein